MTLVYPEQAFVSSRRWTASDEDPYHYEELVQGGQGVTKDNHWGGWAAGLEHYGSGWYRAITRSLLFFPCPSGVIGGKFYCWMHGWRWEDTPGHFAVGPMQGWRAYWAEPVTTITSWVNGPWPDAFDANNIDPAGPIWQTMTSSPAAVSCIAPLEGIGNCVPHNWGGVLTEHACLLLKLEGEFNTDVPNDYVGNVSPVGTQEASDFGDPQSPFHNHWRTVLALNVPEAPSPGSGPQVNIGTPGAATSHSGRHGSGQTIHP